MKITPFYRWFDLWIGLYIDVPKRTAYLCCFGLGLKITRQ